MLLTGKNSFNLATGNAFRFDGVTDEAVLKHRKKGVRIGILVLIIAAIVGFGIGFLATSDLLVPSGEPKTFSAKGMQITLTDEFSKQTAAGYTAGFGSKDVAVLVLKEDFTLQEGFGQLSLKEYGNLVLQNNGKNTTLKTDNGVTYFEYDGTNGNDTYHYVATVFKGPDAFWLIQFATKDTNAAEFRDEIFAWAKTISFE